MTKVEEKIEVISTFFVSVCNGETNYSPDTQPPELKDREEEQNKFPIIQEEMVSDLQHHSDIQKSVGPDAILLRVLRELVEVLIEPLSITYQPSWLAGEFPLTGYHDIHLQEEQEGGCRELQACQSGLCTEEHHGAEHLECYHTP